MLKNQLKELDRFDWVPELPYAHQFHLDNQRNPNLYITEDFIRLEIPIDPEDDDFELIDGEKFEYFKYMENILCRIYSSGPTEADACSFDYSFNSNHMEGPIVLLITITDGLS